MLFDHSLHKFRKLQDNFRKLENIISDTRVDSHRWDKTKLKLKISSNYIEGKAKLAQFFSSWNAEWIEMLFRVITK